MEWRIFGGHGRSMSDSDVRQRGRPQSAGRPVFDLVAAKLRRPVMRPGTVRRSSLIERLRRGEARPIVSVVGPAGYGKTTLLSQWAERNGQSFAWVSVDEPDNDPKVLLSYVAEALDAVEPIDGRVFDALASPVSSVPGSVVPRLGAAFSSMTSPVVLVLDDVHALHNRNAGPRWRCWPITCRAVRGWCWRVGPSRRCGSRGCAPRAGSWRSARATCRSPATRRRRCCATLRWRSARTTWRSCTGGPRGGRPGCTWRRFTCGRAARWRARRSPSAGMTGW